MRSGLPYARLLPRPDAISSAASPRWLKRSTHWLTLARRLKPAARAAGAKVWDSATANSALARRTISTRSTFGFDNPLQFLVLRLGQRAQGVFLRLGHDYIPSLRAVYPFSGMNDSLFAA